MKALFGTFLICSLLVGLGYSLDCFICTNQTRNEDCLAPEQCKPTAMFCQTTVDTVVTLKVNKTSITKKCVTNCSLSSLEFYCCNTDLCNTSGVDDVKVSVTLLSVVICASTLLLKVSL